MGINVNNINRDYIASTQGAKKVERADNKNVIDAQIVNSDSFKGSDTVRKERHQNNIRFNNNKNPQMGTGDNNLSQSIADRIASMREFVQGNLKANFNDSLKNTKPLNNGLFKNNPKAVYIGQEKALNGIDSEGLDEATQRFANILGDEGIQAAQAREDQAEPFIVKDVTANRDNSSYLDDNNRYGNAAYNSMGESSSRRSKAAMNFLAVA
jgi:hypothetical protein